MILALGSVGLAAAMVLSLMMLGRRSGSNSRKPLTLFCAAGIRQPTEQIVAEYEREYGVPIQVQYGGSNTLLGQIEAGGVGDLILVGEDMYAEIACKKGLAREVVPVAVQRPVIAVRKDNPRRIQGLNDLLRADVRVGLCNPEQAAIGRLFKEALGRTGRWRDLDRAVTERGVFKPTVTDLANDLKLGTIDASILWDALVRQNPELEAVECPELKSSTARIAMCVLTSVKAPAAALRFARYFASRDRGQPVFASMGYEAVEGDRWSESPQLTFFAGIVARRALEETIRGFEEREGVVVTTVYNGCGILTGQMLAIRDKTQGGFPDLYLAGDRCFFENVKEHFQEAEELSENGISMFVEKGNPKEIRALTDLTRAGIRVVVGQPEQCTIGHLTRKVLEEQGIYHAVMKNVVSQVATSGMLVPAATTGTCDVVLAWNSDLLGESGRLEAIPVESKHAKGTQVLGIARSSDRKELARRLVAAIAASRASFESAGFVWRLDRLPAARNSALNEVNDGAIPRRRGKQP